MAEKRFDLAFICPLAQNMAATKDPFFCKHCQKQVHDASDWSPEQIDFRLRQAGGELCVAVRETQVEGIPALVLVQSAKRRLRFWETFLLAFLLAWGYITVLPAQTNVTFNRSFSRDSAAIAAVYAENDEACSKNLSDSFPGPIRRIDDPWARIDADWDSLGLIKREHYGGREIILLSQPIFFLRGSNEICNTTVNGNLVQERDYRTLYQSMSIILDFPWKTVAIYGHADASEGTDVDALSRERAEYVESQLRRWGFRQNVEIHAMGSREPYDPALPYGKYPGRNSRVVIVLLEPREN